ncbi:MAG: helix-turn-helix domain-containing protein, partial [Candidatus Hodarchaeota archaeon]
NIIPTYFRILNYYTLGSDVDNPLVDFMSNNQLIKISEKEGQTPSELKPTTGTEKPAIVHELDRNVLEILKNEGPITRARLVSITGIARSTLYDSLLRLILKGYVARFSEERRQRGRPKVYYKVAH